MRYTSIFLDLDNTIFDFGASEKTAIKTVLAEFSLPCDDAAAKLYSEINDSYWKRFERGEIPREAIFEGRFHTLLSTLGKDGDVAAISKNYFKYLSEGHDLVDFAEELLIYLKEKGYRIYITTNGFAFTQNNRIALSGMGKYFDKVFISEEIGAQKPEKAYFDYCAEHIDEKDRSKILVVGDSQSSDILGGINAGLDTCWFNPKRLKGKQTPKYEIGNLKELLDIL